MNRAICCFVVSVGFLPTQGYAQDSWETVATVGKPTARHEAAFVGVAGKLYLIGGRRINPVDEYDPATNRWTSKSKTPVELHHFQPVVVDDRVYLMGAMTGRYPGETPLERIITYHPKTDAFEFGHEIPKNRRRGGAGTVVYNDKIYLVGGITNGHIDGFQPWLDEYDPKTGEWRVLPDAPHARDHFQAAVIGDRLYAVAGRTTSKATNQVFDLTVDRMDVFDFKTETWLPENASAKIPTPRAGNMVIAIDGKLVVGGGESVNQRAAHQEIEVYNPATGQWSNWPKLVQGRHGSGFVQHANYIYTASGCGNRGGNPELETLERLPLPTKAKSVQD